MAKTKISEFSSTPANNTDIDSINIAEGCAPSNINDAIRELMAQLKDFQTGAQGDSFNGPIGTSTAAAGAFTTLSATGAITSTLATGSAPLVIASTTKVANLNVDLLDGADWASPAALGSTTPAAVSATTLSASGAVSGTGFSNYLASPPAIGGTTAAAGSFTTLTTSSTVTLNGGTANGVTYLNGSKQLVSGSALTFDGTKLVATATTGASTTYPAYFDNSGGGVGTGSRIGFRNTGVSYGEIGYLYDGAFSMVINSAGSGESRFLIGGSEAMRLTSTSLYTASGINVGIGTSSPAFKLDLNGVGAVRAGNAIRYYRTDNAIYTELYDAGSSGFTLNNANGNGFRFQSAGSTQATLDSAGNLGLGTAPSATWFTGSKVFQIGTTGALWNNGSNQTALSHNAVFNNSDARYLFTEEASYYSQLDGQHRWFTAPSGTAGDAISFTQSMTLTSDGNLGVGTTSIVNNIGGGTTMNLGGLTTTEMVIQGSYQYVNNAPFQLTFKNLYTGGSVLGSISAYLQGAVNSGALIFSTASGGTNTERARITSGGYFKASNTGTYQSATSTYHELRNDANANTVRISNTIASGYTDAVAQIAITGYSPNTTNSWFLFCNDSTATRAEIRSNGGIANYSANDVNLSDRREKTNFAPAGEYLSKICAIPVQTFNYIDQNLEEDDGLTLGVVAQDVQAVAPELVMESNWGTEENPKMRLSIYQTDLQYALMKCIQEQQAIIESLKARLDAANL